MKITFEKVKKQICITIEQNINTYQYEHKQNRNTYKYIFKYVLTKQFCKTYSCICLYVYICFCVCMCNYMYVFMSCIQCSLYFINIIAFPYVILNSDFESRLARSGYIILLLQLYLYVHSCHINKDISINHVPTRVKKYRTFLKYPDHENLRHGVIISDFSGHFSIFANFLPMHILKKQLII